MTFARDGGLLQLFPNSPINLYASGSNPSLVCIVSTLLSCWSKPLKKVAILGEVLWSSG